MLDFLLLGSFLILCLHVMHPNKDTIMKYYALLPLYDVQVDESLPEICKQLKKLDA